MRDHELRKQVVSEMHLRRWPVLSVPCFIVQWVLIVAPEEREDEAAYLDGFRDPEARHTNAPHLSGFLADGVEFSWERHSEGTSLSLFIDDVSEEELASATLPDRVHEAIEWARGLPGKIMRAIQIRVVADDAAAERLLPHMDFLRSELISCNFGGAPRMWGDFRLKDDGFGKLVVAANGTDLRDFSRLVQRLQDLDNYRNRALLGLPTAQKAWPKLDAVGVRLAEVAARIAGDEAKDDILLEQLSTYSAELNAIANAIDYRLSATAAYAQLVNERLEQLRVTPIDGYASLVDFTQRRFLPAIRTCAAVKDRQLGLSARAERAASLLRARISTRIENQNAELLRSMDRSTRMQLRLQQLVEGLSVVALSYYLIGLVGYVLKGAGHRWPGLDAEVALAVITLPVVLVVWLATRLLKKRLLQGPDRRLP
ncbi:DUF3422 family protein [Aurantiacibacter zhengii]|uniref:DUF3422 family protein n=1 Tax=Aurantiacibacter zhengii TaxID=2307003 RepID=A0A418NV29_9SPHN|nr:DUF3422 domain-containing protein [Aurantiacibacter zhengii]RIV87788.1 DUF3422 family protein [Aurantiacibacter zhengii]